MIFLLFLGAYALNISFCAEMKRDQLLPCFTMAGTGLTRPEVTTFIATHPLVSAMNVTTSLVFQNCDITGDNVLNMTDWIHPAGCVKSQKMITHLCILCVANGWVF